MGFANDFFDADATAFTDAWGESITYTPVNGAATTIDDAILDRGQLEPVAELGGQVGAQMTVLHIRRSLITTISKGDSFSFSDVQGGTTTDHYDVQIDRAKTDTAFWVLNVR